MLKAPTAFRSPAKYFLWSREINLSRIADDGTPILVAGVVGRSFAPAPLAPTVRRRAKRNSIWESTALSRKPSGYIWEFWPSANFRVLLSQQICFRLYLGNVTEKNSQFSGFAEGAILFRKRCIVELNGSRFSYIAVMFCTKHSVSQGCWNASKTYRYECLVYIGSV